MKKQLLIFFLACNILANAQYMEEFDANNIRAKAVSKGVLFENITTYNSGFEVPSGNGTHTIYSAGLCVAGKDIYCDMFSDIFANYSMYNVNSPETRPGPIMDSIYYSSQAAQWNYVWKVNKTDIIYHITNYNQPGYIMPNDISSWPAHGNTALGQAQYLAPFIDTDLDGFYNPMNGDYPAIKGDQSLYVIYNDDFGNSGNMKTEVHIMVYGFNCPTDNSFHNTLFVHYKIFNRSNRTYCNSYTGMFVDFDLGNAMDDYIGTDVMRTSTYCYNGDNFDEQNGFQTEYGVKPPAQSITLLKGPLLDADGIDNPETTNIQNAIDSMGIVYPYFAVGYGDGVVDNERAGLSYSVYFNNSMGPTGNPHPYFYNQFYNYLSGKWTDNTDFYFGGNGYITSQGVINCGSVKTKYLYTGDVNGLTSDPLYWATEGIIPTCNYNWSELSEFNPAGDRRIMLSSGKFTFYPGDMQDIEFAFVYGRDLSALGNNLTSIQVMQRNIDTVKRYYHLNQTPCGNNFNYFVNTPENIINNPDFKIFPNPTNNFLNIEVSLPINNNENIKYTIHDLSGKQVFSSEITSKKSTLDLEFLSNGMYYIVFKSAKYNKTEKFIIQH